MKSFRLLISIAMMSATGLASAQTESPVAQQTSLKVTFATDSFITDHNSEEHGPGYRLHFSADFLEGLRQKNGYEAQGYLSTLLAQSCGMPVQKCGLVGIDANNVAYAALSIINLHLEDVVNDDGSLDLISPNKYRPGYSGVEPVRVAAGDTWFSFKNPSSL